MLYSFLLLALLNTVDGWNTFADVEFEMKFIKELGYEIEMPVFDDDIRQLAGQEIVLKGYYIPLEYDRRSIVLSKMPYTSCYFCGGGGLETIAEIHFAENQKRFKPDDLLTIRGKLRLNDNNLEHLFFILEEAELVK